MQVVVLIREMTGQARRGFGVTGLCYDDAMATEWLQRVAGDSQKRDSPVDQLVANRGRYGCPEQFSRAVLDLFPPGQSLADEELAAVLSFLENENWGDSQESRHAVALLEQLAARSSDERPLVFLAEMLVGVDRKREALTVFLTVAEVAPTVVAEIGGEFAELATRYGGEDLLRYRLIHAKSALVDGDDEVRELYSELLEDYAGDVDAMARIRQLGVEIDAAVAGGRLSKAMVLRGEPVRKS